MNKKFNVKLSGKLDEMKDAGKYKVYQYLKTPMSNKAELENFDEVIVLCSNNYLGLSSNPVFIKCFLACFNYFLFVTESKIVI